MAEVQIGSHKLVAKLEVPMKAGDAYYFQVSAVKPELQLKIISGPLQGAEGQGRQLGSLLEAMQLPKNAEMQSLVAFAMKQKLPMTREQLLAAEQLMKLVPRAQFPEALTTIQKLIDVKLPLTETHFRSVFGVQAKEGLQTLFQSFSTALSAEQAISPQAKEAILASLGRMAQPFGQATGGVILGQAILTLLNPGETMETKFNILQLLKSADMLPARTSLANIQQVLTSLSAEGRSERPSPPLAGASQTLQATAQNREMSQASPAVQLTAESKAPPAQTAPAESPKAPIAPAPNQPAALGQSSPSVLQQLVGLVRQTVASSPDQAAVQFERAKALLANENTLTGPQRSELTAIIDRAAQTQASPGNAANFVQQLSQAVYRIAAQQAVAEPFSPVAGQQLVSLTGLQGTERLESVLRLAERSDNPAIQKMVQNAEASIANVIDGKAVKEAIQSITRSFGLQYEAELLSKEPDIARLAESLKPQLIALMRDASMSPALRETAEAIVMRMNGPLIQSGETGIQHQLVMQVPLELFGRKIDSTLQWSGRMKEDGKIDPDYARILFYLDLESIEKTVIDMQVQNRVVSVTVFNDEAGLRAIGAPLQARLKNGLSEAGYTLSGVFFKPLAEEVKPEAKKASPIQTDGQGVDFRI